jgi:hypothetical protein
MRSIGRVLIGALRSVLGGIETVVGCDDGGDDDGGWRDARFAEVDRQRKITDDCDWRVRCWS